MLTVALSLFPAPFGFDWTVQAVNPVPSRFEEEVWNLSFPSLLINATWYILSPTTVMSMPLKSLPPAPLGAVWLVQELKPVPSRFEEAV